MLERARLNPATVRQAMAHDSAARHVSGEAIYVDDLPEARGQLHIWPALSPHASARIVSMDLSEVEKQPGVVGVYSASSIPAKNDCSPSIGDDPIFPESRVDFAGQVIFAVAAESELAARMACNHAQVQYEIEDPILSVDDALRQSQFVLPSSTVNTGDSELALQNATHKISGRLSCGGQDHFYLEGQAAMAVPKEAGDLVVYSSTQHPSEVQHLIAHALGKSFNSIIVEVRRMGGAFGGKESQAAQTACIAAIVANKTGRAAKMRLDRDIDMLSTGKRHDFKFDYDVGFDDDGRIQALQVNMASRCGYSADLSGPINGRALLHIDNAYYVENLTATTHLCRTNTVSNTAFRGFGAPQAMLCIERIIDEIAFALSKDPVSIRQLNYYGKEDRNVTPYGMKITDFVLSEMTEELLQTSDYLKRRKDIRHFNRTSPIIRRGIALTPVKFGISFTMSHYNQAGALIHVYTDGSVHLNHGGTEMGQGLFIKVAQVVAEEFALPLESIKITETNTSRVPNPSATAASSGSDMNGKAAQDAAQKLKRRLSQVAAHLFRVDPKAIEFINGNVVGGRHSITFTELVNQAYRARVSLSATGYYKTPKINWDAVQMKGRPFYYFGYGVAVSEVAVDTLTGEHQLRRVDILHDTGRSLNPAIDLGQIEGGFVQCMGWLTSEELWWDSEGHLKTHAPSTYKIPTSGDVPDEFYVNIWDRGRNEEDTIYRSKAVGEPPLMLGISVFCAIADAISSLSNYQVCPKLDAPATPERVLMVIQNLKN